MTNARRLRVLPGLALYQAQCLEHGIVNAMVIGGTRERDRVTRAQIEAFETNAAPRPVVSADASPGSSTVRRLALAHTSRGCSPNRPPCGDRW